MSGPWEKYQKPADQIQPADTEESGPWQKYTQSPATGQNFNVARMAPTEPAEFKAAPTGIVPWLGNAEDDLRLGGHRTMVGKALGFMQGNGDRGYSGMQSGVSPETAEFMGSPALGVTHAAKGLAEIEQGHPLTGAKDAVSGGMQAATIPSMMVAGPGAEMAAEAIPSAKFAGHTLEDIRNAASDVNVNPNNAWPEIERYQELTKRGGSTAKPMTQMSARLQNMVRQPDLGPMKFPEARDFYSNISSQSAEDMSRLNPIMRRQMGGVRSGLHQDLTDAASTIGRGEDYANAVKEYAQAKRMQDILKTSAKWAVPIAVGGGVAGTAIKRMMP